jgi:hypothetical protein
MKFFPGFRPVVPCKNPEGSHPLERGFPYSHPLPLASNAERLEYQNPLPMDNQPIWLACLECKSVCHYTARDVLPYPIPTSGRRKDWIADPVAFCFRFHCGIGACTSRITMYVIIDKSNKPDLTLREKLAAQLRECTFYTTCANGHVPQFPKSNKADQLEMLWGNACWPPL